MSNRFYLLIVLVFLYITTYSQTTGPDPRELNELHIKKATGPIILDGELDEGSWQDAESTGNFWLKYPRDGEPAEKKTQVKAVYDDTYLYIAAVLYDNGGYVVQTLKRDSRFFDGDGFAVVLDPMDRRTNGFLFGVSPYNVQSEDLLSSAGFGNINFSWDNKWYSEVRRYEDRWVVEMAIPFKTLRFKSGNNRWGINFFRNDLKLNQYHSWTPMPVNFDLTDLGYTGSLIWEESPEKTGTNIALIPYLSGSVTRDKEVDPALSKENLDAGFDAKIAISSSLNLDLTVNPDFSQIDVDVQQTNLTRFNLNFPERRGFFLENNDLFTEYGTPPARPIFTRRMGLDENAQPVPILYGARLSGNLGRNFRLGILNLQTQASETRSGQNYTIATFNQSIFKRSLIKGYLTNRQAIVKGEGVDYSDYGRNAGLEFNYLNLPGTWRYFAAIHLSDKPGFGLGTYRNAGFQHSGRNLSVFLDYFGIDSDYYADIGFIPRLDNYDAARDTVIHLGYEHFFGRIGYTFRPAGDSRIIAQEVSARNWVDLNPDGSLNERRNQLGYELRFRNTSTVEVRLEDNDTRLLFATRFTPGDPILPGPYRYQRASLNYTTDGRSRLAAEAGLEVGEFYNGDLNRFNAGLTYRVQPWGNFNLSMEQNYLRLPEPYGELDLTLVNQRTEINFSTKLFWTTFFQYNTQQNNFNINTRLQWRFHPMSDLFLVFTDNYSSSPFLQTNKNRGVVFKLNYWFTF